MLGPPSSPRLPVGCQAWLGNSICDCAINSSQSMYIVTWPNGSPSLLVVQQPAVQVMCKLISQTVITSKHHLLKSYSHSELIVEVILCMHVFLHCHLIAFLCKLERELISPSEHMWKQTKSNQCVMLWPQSYSAATQVQQFQDKETWGWDLEWLELSNVCCLLIKSAYLLNR